MDPIVLPGALPEPGVIADQLVDQFLSSPTTVVGSIWELLIGIGIALILRRLKS